VPTSTRLSFAYSAGTTPFVGESIAELAVKVATEPPPPVRSFRPEVSVGLETVIFKCLQRDRRGRYANVAELAVALLEFGPKRAKVWVERISGILQAAGLSASALDLPPSLPSAAGTLVGPETIAPVGRTAAGATGRMTRVVGAGVIGLVSLVALVGVVSWLKRETAPSHGSQMHTVQSSSPTTSLMPQPVTPPVTVARKGAEDMPGTLGPGVAPSADLPLIVEAGTTPITTPTGIPAPTTPNAPPPSQSAKTAASPCKLVTILDKNGEAHFSCPCGSCR
jgi:hypothetical protein